MLLLMSLQMAGQEISGTVVDAKSKEQTADYLAEKSLFFMKNNEMTLQEASLCGAIGMFLPAKSMQIGG